MSIPIKSNGTGKIYLGDKIICDTPCQNYDTSIIVLEGRLGRDSTSSRQGGLYIYNDDFTIIGWAGHTSFQGRRVEFNYGSSSTFYTNSFTGFKEFRISYNKDTDTIHYEMRDTLDSGTVTYSLDKSNLGLYKGGGIIVGLQSNDSYYHNGQFDWFRIKDKDGNVISYIDFEDNQLPLGYTLYNHCNSMVPVSDGYSISNGILTLSTNPYCRALLYDEAL